MFQQSNESSYLLYLDLHSFVLFFLRFEAPHTSLLISVFGIRFPYFVPKAEGAAVAVHTLVTIHRPKIENLSA